MASRSRLRPVRATLEAVGTPVLNIYCDESCHLERDQQTFMTLGATWLPATSVQDLSERIRTIKDKHNIPRAFEVKWTKVSPGAVNFYLDLVDVFFDAPEVKLRVVVANKASLDHTAFRQTHDEWYYKMYYTLLIPLIHPGSRYRIFLDIKDTRGGPKTSKLREVLSNKIRDFDLVTIERLQIVRSEEVEALQLTDLLIGAIGYANRGGGMSGAKSTVAQRVAARAGRPLDKTTPLSSAKLNLLRWSPQTPF